MRKLRVGILFGGQSAEHEVSLRSAKNVVDALDRTKYEPVLIGIEKTGKWLLAGAEMMLPAAVSLALPSNGRDLALNPGGEAPAGIDVAFPVLHGTNGEDGTVQGMLTLLGIPYVGPNVLGSAIGMDKDACKRLLRDAGIPIAGFRAFRSHERASIDFHKLTTELSLPFFVKPANAGSSVGVHKIKTEADFLPAVDDAFLYDTKVLFEEFIQGREIECAVLGNEKKTASVPGEIIPHLEFYSYEAKYLDENGAGLEIPAKLSPDMIKHVQEIAIQTCDVLCVEGMARVDFFLRGSELIVNEINTIPGFTSISMYPKMWGASGLSYQDLIDRLIELALERHARDRKIKRTF